MNARIDIDPAAEAVTFDRMLFGQFIEHFHRQIYGGIFDPGSPLSDEQGFRQDVIEALGELRVPIVRWPGGCFASAYHWYDGVGPTREAVYDKAWQVEDPNTFGTDEFVTWCRKIGAEPYVCTNAGTGPPEESSDWVEYCNLTIGKWAKMRRQNGYPEPHRVRYWSIGNENYGAWEVGAKSPEEFAAYVRETAKMMRFVDPNLKLFAPALPTKEWTEPLLREAGKYLDYVSIHGYWDPLWRKNNPSDYTTCMAKSLEPEKLIANAERMLVECGYEGKLDIAVDEWNLRGWHHPRDNTPEALRARDKNDINATYTMADAIFSAVFLNTCLRHTRSVRMANTAPIVNARGPLLAHPGGIVRRTTFHVLRMYSDLLAPAVVEASVTSDAFAHADVEIPALDAVATRENDSANHVLALVNRHPTSELTCEIRLGDRQVGDQAQTTLLAGDAVEAFNDVDRPDRVVPQRLQLRVSQGSLRLPPHSVTLCELAGGDG